MKVSREKLAWIIDSTASPVAVLIPFIGWGVYIMGLIKQEFDNLQVTESEFTVFVQAIPFQFYSFFSYPNGTARCVHEIGIWRDGKSGKKGPRNRGIVLERL